MSAPQQNARKISEQLFYAILSKEREQQSVLRTQTACWFENAVKDHDGCNERQEAARGTSERELLTLGSRSDRSRKLVKKTLKESWDRGGLEYPFSLLLKATRGIRCRHHSVIAHPTACILATIKLGQHRCGSGDRYCSAPNYSPHERAVRRHLNQRVRIHTQQHATTGNVVSTPTEMVALIIVSKGLSQPSPT